MYHRFNENKYPSTNVKMDIFKNQIEIIRGKGLNFYNPLDFKDEFAKPKNVLLGHLLCAFIGIVFVTVFKVSQDRSIFFL